jgi:hypothetical protein
MFDDVPRDNGIKLTLLPNARLQLPCSNVKSTSTFQQLGKIIVILDSTDIPARLAGSQQEVSSTTSYLKQSMTLRKLL